MSWGTALGHLKKLAARGLAGVGQKDADDGLPMGVRVGSVLRFRASPFLRATGSLVGAPGEVECVEAISRLRAEIDGTVHRFYTERGDGASERETFLQVYGNDQGEIAERVFFRRLVRLMPTTAEEQASFMGTDGCGLGASTFSLYKEQLLQLGLSEMALEEAFGSSDSIEYRRTAGDASKEFVQPFKGKETRVDDSQGVDGLRQDVVFMLYSRALANGREEQLVISTEIVEDQNGDKSKRELHVDFMVGLPLEEGDVMVA